MPRALPAALAADLEPFGPLPLRPVVVRSALHLVGGGGDTPEESGLRSQVSCPRLAEQASKLEYANPGPGTWDLEAAYGSSVAWCFTQRASAMKIVSSQMFVARSPTRSRF